jgi:Zn-finger nucleic acid-binding protein
MICPNDKAEMHQVKVESHYGQPIIIEQCNKCGGLWFDKFELHRIKLGESEKIEVLDSENLWTPSSIQGFELTCPKDQAKLARFSDPYFPKDIIVERCPVCDGFWLNRGEFTKYQKARQEMKTPKEKSVEETKFKKDVREILAAYQDEGNTSTLGRLGKFLSTPLDETSLEPLNPEEMSPEEGCNLDTILNVLTSILSAVIPGKLLL